MAMPVCCSDAVRLPPSKSIEARRMVLDVVRGYDLRPVDDVNNLCDDLRYLRQALEGYQRRQTTLFLGSSGTALRFMLALTAATPDYEVSLTGTDQLHRRPVEPLVKELTRMGAHVGSSCGYAPLRVRGARLRGDLANPAELLHTDSSQYLSALLLAEPLFSTPLPPLSDSDLAGSVSAPYVHLTRHMVASDGISEVDWSSASYFYLVSILMREKVVFEPSLTMPSLSLQGDSACAEIFKLMGIETTFEDTSTTIFPAGGYCLPEVMDMHAVPDLVPAVAVAAALTGHRLRITGIGHLRVKESNRLQSICEALHSIGAEAESDTDSICVTGSFTPPARRTVVDCHDDHRIAMCMAPAAALLPAGLTLRGAECVAKSFPDFFHQLTKAHISAL